MYLICRTSQKEILKIIKVKNKFKRNSDTKTEYTNSIIQCLMMVITVNNK